MAMFQYPPYIIVFTEEFAEFRTGLHSVSTEYTKICLFSTKNKRLIR